MLKKLFLAAAIVVLVAPSQLVAEGIVSTIVNAPLSATGTVENARVGINVYLQSEDNAGIDFMDPSVVGYGIPAGGRLEIEMGGDFERDWAIDLTQSAIILVTGAPQQGLPGKAAGYEVEEGENDNTFVITPTKAEGIVAEKLMSPSPGVKGDLVKNRGIKVIHIGFQQSAFINNGDAGTVSVRIVDSVGSVVSSGSESISFLDAPVAQVLPTNFPQQMRNHNWQTIKPGDTLGQTEGTLPLTFMMYDQASARDTDALYAFKDGIENIGVLSTQQLVAAGFEKSESMARYNGGLVMQDTDKDGLLDPVKDKIIGGVLANAPQGARGQELRSLVREGKPVLSVLTEKIAEKPGKRWGGSMLMLQFTAGDKPGKYRPTVALMKDPGDPAAGDGSSFTYTIQVK